MDLYELAERVGGVEAVDPAAETLAAKVHRLAPPGSRVKDVLSGTWLGHPLHPLLTDIPIGCFTSASVLDLFGGRGSVTAANRLVALGLLASVATAAAGASDWSDTSGPDRRTGLVHGATNAAGVTMYGLSALARRRGRRGSATVMGLAGMTVMTVAGHLGGHLAFGRAVGVNRTATETRPEDWTDVAVLDDLDDGSAVGVDADGACVLLRRRGDAMTAISARCSHAGGPLEEGEVDTNCGTVTCPWHQSVFDLASGSVVHGPAAAPQPAYEVRAVVGRVEVRAPTVD